MDVERYDRDESPREDLNSDDLEENGNRHRSKDRKKSGRGEEKDGRSKERDRLRRGGDEAVKERRKEDRDERYKDRSGRDSKVRERDYEHERGKERKDRGKDREVEKDGDKGRDKERDKERGKEKSRDRERDRTKEKEREKEREKHKDREKSLKDTDREKGKDKREVDQDKEKSRDRHGRRSVDAYESSKTGERDESANDDKDKDLIKQGKISHGSDYEQNAEGLSGGANLSASELEERILKTKEERLKKKTEDVPEVLAWVNRSRKLEEKRNAEKEKALQLSKIFEEQDNVGEEESEDEEEAHDMTHNLAGVKVLHGIDKVLEGGAVVLTLKDQNILADGDINEDVDMLENVELGEQKQRDDAYKAAKKKTGIYVDKFNEDPTSEKKILPKYDDPAADEGLTLDARGRFTGEAEKKLEELRMRLQGGFTKPRSEDLNMSGKIASDYYTNEEMLQLKKPKKKKTFRRKEKLDLDALEAEAISAGLGAADLGSRKDGKRQANREEEERLEAEKRSSAYQLAKAKANEASKALRQDTLSVKAEEDETPYFADDYDEIDKALERSRMIALKKKQEEMASGPKAIALLATAAASKTADDQDPSTGQSQENKVVFTEMEEFVLGLQLEEESHKPECEDVSIQEDEEPKASVEEEMSEPSGQTEANEIEENKEQSGNDDKEEMVPDETIREVAVGKGLSGVLKLLKERGNLKEGIEWGGRNMDKKKRKLLGIVVDDQEPKDIHIERTDEFGRTLTPKEDFRVHSHKFHGKGPGKMKQEKRMKQYHEELKLKQMKSSDTPSLSLERMRETQARLQTPHLVLTFQRSC